MSRALLVLAVVVAPSACTPTTGTPDAASFDDGGAPTLDAGRDDDGGFSLVDAGSSDGGDPDAGLVCAQAIDALETFLASNRSCEESTDCAFFGTYDEPGSCNCHLGPYEWGVAVRAAASAQAAPLVQDVWSLCSEDDCAAASALDACGACDPARGRRRVRRRRVQAGVQRVLQPPRRRGVSRRG